jgi:amidohydrolase
MPPLPFVARSSPAEMDLATPAELIELRRDLHAHPGVRFEVERTADIVAGRLRAAGWEVTTGVGRTGVVARRDSGLPGPHVLLRADTDAMPVPDTKAVSYASTVPGVAHACGHDVHTTVLVGVAERLAAGTLARGRLTLIFQPAEETPYGAESGAQAMLADGLFDAGVPDAAVALHCWPGLRVGTVGVDSRVAMAAKDAFQIRLAGRSAHAATPSGGRDAILGVAQLVSALHAGVARSLDVTDRAAFNVGTLRAGASQSVVADAAEITGTIRSLTPEIRERLMAVVERITHGVAAANGLEPTITWMDPMPPVVNDAHVAAVGLRVGRELLGADAIELTEPPMTADDFAFIAEQVPSLYFKLGTCGGSACPPLHNGAFDVDERAIGVGMAVMAGIARRLLEPAP